MKISVLGCGRWGSFIAWYLDNIGHDILLWGRESSDNFKQIKDTRKNGIITFKDNIHLTNDLEKATDHAQILVISISCQALASFCESLSAFDLAGKTIVLCMKGIDEKSTMRLTEIVRKYIDKTSPVAIWVGPGHVEDFIKGVPNCMVIDSEDNETKKFLVERFSSDLIRFYIGSDLIGNEIGAAAKNVIGIAAGMLDGIGYASLKGALMSRGTREIARLIIAMGGKEISAYGLCHLGDYQATLFSEHSHNRKFGEMFIQGKKYTKLAEGVATTRALVKLGEKYNVDLPITNAINSIVNKNKDPNKVLSELFLRSIKKEF